jgi:hypothetical protein
MPSTYTLISSTVLSSATDRVEFTSIPATYTDLVLRISARSTRSATSNNMDMRLNADSSSLYSWTYIYNSATTAYSSKTSAIDWIFVGTLNAANSLANTFTSAEVYIPSYTASQSKQLSTFSVYENNTAPPATSNEIDAGANLYRSNTAISSITLTSSVGSFNFAAESSFYLYGIKNS